MTTAEKKKAGYSQLVPAVDQAARILFCLARSPRSELPLTEICNQVGIHKSKGYSILNTLMESHLVVRDPASKTYSLGPGLLFLSRAVLDNSDVRRVAAPYLTKLAEQTQSTALLGMVSGDRVFVVAKEETADGIGITIRVGHRYPLTWGSHGKAIVAILPEEERERALGAEHLFFYGDADSSQVDRASLRRELEEVRRLGYAKDLGRMQPGVRAVSAPILGAEAVPIGCVIVVGTFPESSADEFGEKAAATAGEISALLGPTMQRIYRKAGSQPSGPE